MTQLETSKVSELESFKRALDAAGVSYDTQVTYSIEIAQDGAQAVSADTSGPATAGEAPPVDALPGEGTKAREIVDFVAEHPREWVTERDLPDDIGYGYDDGQLSMIYRRYNVLDKKHVEPDAREGRHGRFGYKLKEPYRRELTGQAIDVEALTEARNA